MTDTIEAHPPARLLPWHEDAVAQLRHAWNAGRLPHALLLQGARADTFADRLRRFLPEVDRRIGTAFRGDRKGFDRRLRNAYRHMPSVSVDYGILEKERGILVLPADVGWSDLGTWHSLHEFLGGSGGNVTFGDVILEECRDCLVRTDAGVVAVLGMDAVVVVRSGDAVLVCPRSRSEEVKRMAEGVRRRFPALS